MGFECRESGKKIERASWNKQKFDRPVQSSSFELEEMNLYEIG